jgi:uncharacterized damage-inducible protein DinB/putative sterol carrier protein
LVQIKTTDRALRNRRDVTQPAAAVGLRPARCRGDQAGKDATSRWFNTAAVFPLRKSMTGSFAASLPVHGQEKEQDMNNISTLERLFRYKAQANDEFLAAIRLFDDASAAKQIAITILSHAYVVDKIFAANLTAAAHGYTSANKSKVPTVEELSGAIKASDQWYIDYVSSLKNAQLAEWIDFTFTDGAPGRMSREEMLLHVMIHGASHRGQVGWIMIENSITPPVDRLTSYLHTAEAPARRRGASSGAVETDRAVNGPNTAPLAEPRPDETSAKEKQAMSRLDALTERMKAAVGADSGLGKTLKFNLKGEGFIYIDSGLVTNEDKPADLTLTVTIDDLRAMGQGKLSPATAVMTGRLGLSDMGLAMGLRGEMQALFSKMQPPS